MKRLPISRATASLADYVQRLGDGPLAVTEKGKPVAVLVPIEGMDWESLALGTNPDFLDLIERSRRRHEQEGGISSEEIRREFGLPPYEEKPKRKPRKKTANRKRRTGTDGSQV